LDLDWTQEKTTTITQPPLTTISARRFWEPFGNCDPREAQMDSMESLESVESMDSRFHGIQFHWSPWNSWNAWKLWYPWNPWNATEFFYISIFQSDTLEGPINHIQTETRDPKIMG
jgi:hypothetical protein